MKYRNFGQTNLQVSEIGFGAWAIGGGAMVGNTAIGWGNVDDNESKKSIFSALDCGINFFDTADIYGLGHSESIIGQIIGNNQEAIIASKVGNVARNETFGFDYSFSYIMEACEASLKRLKREAIDYYQLHTARMPHLEQGDCLKAMELLKKQGKIKHWGISLNTFEPNAEAEFFIENNYGDGFQLVLNLINKKSLPLIKIASDKGYGIIARMPLQFGLLTGKFDENMDFEANDHRYNRITKEIVAKTNETLETVYSLCNKYDCNKTTLALSYILSYNEVSTIIPGIRTSQHVALNTANLIKLEIEDKAQIEALDNSVLLHLIFKQG